MNHKFYSMLALAFLFSSEGAFAKSVVQKCVDVLSAIDAPAPRPITPERSSYYRAYASTRPRERGPRTLPFDNDSAPDALQSSFFYWWYPGNVYEKLMVPLNEELAQTLLAGEPVPTKLLPTPKELKAEAAYRARQPIEPKPDEPEILPEEKSSTRPRAADMPSDPLETSPTKDAPNAHSVAAPTPAAAPVGDADLGMSFDSGPPPSTGP